MSESMATNIVNEEDDSEEEFEDEENSDNDMEEFEDEEDSDDAMGYLEDDEEPANENDILIWDDEDNRLFWDQQSIESSDDSDGE